MTLNTALKDWLAVNAGTGTCYAGSGVNYTDADGVAHTGRTGEVITAFYVAHAVGKDSAIIIANTNYTQLRVINGNADVDINNDISWVLANDGGSGSTGTYCIVTTGSISCTTTPPGASVALDGVSQGVVTPVNLANVSVGSHTVTFNLSGYNACPVSVTVTAGSTATASCTMTPIVTTGSISCTTTPSGASVALDGIPQGVVTPVTLTNVSAGSHTVTFTLSGYNACPVSVTVTAGSTATASCTLTPIVTTGSISCTTTPSGASVSLDGVSRGVVTPTTLTNISAGSHTVTFTLSGYNACPVSVTVTAGSTATASCTLTPVITTGSISCTTTPFGASVYLDGTLQSGAITPVTLTSVSAGSHAVMFRLSGYADCTQNVTVTAGSTAAVSCTMTPIVTTGSISCTTAPAGASIYLDGTLQSGAITPVTLTSVSAGSHAVMFRLSGYADCTQNVTVTAGSTAAVSCTLTPTTGNLLCTTTPSGAQIWLDGVDTSYQTPVQFSNVSVGPHTVMFRLSGYADCTQNVMVTAASTTTASCTLTFITTGSISCITTPAGALVSLDGVNRGVVTPTMLINVPAGTHTVTFTLSGYNGCPVSVAVNAGSTATASCTLTPLCTDPQCTINMV